MSGGGGRGEASPLSHASKDEPTIGEYPFLKSVVWYGLKHNLFCCNFCSVFAPSQFTVHNFCDPPNIVKFKVSFPLNFAYFEGEKGNPFGQSLLV